MTTTPNIALVSGAAKRIGRAIALDPAAQGWRVEVHLNHSAVEANEVVAAVRGGLLSLEEACERYRLTVDEFLSWQRSIDKHGLAGLRATRVQEYRQ